MAIRAQKVGRGIERGIEEENVGRGLTVTVAAS
jgi:hypothetical protein